HRRASMRVSVLSFCFALIAVGCGGTTAGSGGAGAGAGGSAGSGAGGSGGSGGTGGAGGQYTLAATVSVGPIAIDRGQETTVCITKRLPIDHPIDVTRIETTLAPGSHHMILYKSSDTTEHPNPVGCMPFVGIIQGTIPLFIAESP